MLAADNVKVPLPSFVKLNAPLVTPLSVRFAVVGLRVAAPVRVVAPKESA